MRRVLPLAGILVVLLAGCSGHPKAATPAATPSPFTRSQVLGWITPTLGNGISLVGSAPPGASAVQLAAATQPLNTAVSVSLHELGQASWNGSLRIDEKSLVRALNHIKTLTATTPTGPAYLMRLDADIAGAEGALRALATQVKRSTQK
jgi:hypothetical protein